MVLEGLWGTLGGGRQGRGRGTDTEMGGFLRGLEFEDGWGPSGPVPRGGRAQDADALNLAPAAAAVMAAESAEAWAEDPSDDARRRRRRERNGSQRSLGGTGDAGPRRQTPQQPQQQQQQQQQQQSLGDTNEDPLPQDQDQNQNQPQNQPQREWPTEPVEWPAEFRPRTALPAIGRKGGGSSRTMGSIGNGGNGRKSRGESVSLLSDNRGTLVPSLAAARVVNDHRGGTASLLADDRGYLPPPPQRQRQRQLSDNRLVGSDGLDLLLDPPGPGSASAASASASVRSGPRDRSLLSDLSGSRGPIGTKLLDGPGGSGSKISNNNNNNDNNNDSVTGDDLGTGTGAAAGRAAKADPSLASSISFSQAVTAASGSHSQSQSQSDVLTVQSYQTGDGTRSSARERYDEMVEEIRQLLDAVNMSVFPSTLRLTALEQAYDYFDHRDRGQHDVELAEGAAYVLYQKLAFVTYQAGGGVVEAGKAYNRNENDNAAATAMDVTSTKSALAITSSLDVQIDREALGVATTLLESTDKELALIIGCLEMVHMASSSSVAAVWSTIGQDVLSLLVNVLERPSARAERAIRIAQATDESGGPTSVSGIIIERAIREALNQDLLSSVQRVTKLLAIYSLVPQAKVAMADCPGLLTALVQIIDTQKSNDDLYEKPPKGYRRNKAEEQPGNDASKGQKEDESMMKQPLPSSAKSSLDVTSGLGVHMTEAARFNAIATITNLAAAEPNCINMLAEPGLVDGVARVVHNEKSNVARQCAALAIMNLSNGDKDHVPELSDLILETLLVLISDEASETRRNGAVALFNVACADQNTIRLVRYKDGAILEALSNLLVSDDFDQEADDDNEAKANVAETLFNMSCSEMTETTDRMADHYGLLENLALTLRSPFASIDVKMYCAATLRRMAEIIHPPKLCHGALLTALVKACIWTRTPCIALAFLAQAEGEGNRSIMAQHHGLLTGLSRLGLCDSGEEADTIRAAAVNAIELISREASTRKLLATNEGIVMALTRASYGIDPASTMSGSSVRGAGLGLDSQKMQDDIAQPSTKHSNGSAEVLESRRIRIALKKLVVEM